MNEQINKLFGQAMDQSIPETWTTLTSEQLARLRDKFAELILKECFEVLKPVKCQRTECGQRNVELLQEHFGVEE
jgi:hypothetical protein